jgi:NAD(P)-dependent dehydrogenase (short-subunit alcohol dehydrogenase family)
MALTRDGSSGAPGTTPERWGLVAGATGCVGGAVADSLAAAGWNLVVHSGRRPEVAAELARELTEKHGVRTLPADADFTDAGALDRLRESLVEARIGSLSALVNCATAFSGNLMPASRLEHAEFRRVLDVDLVGPYLLVRELLPLLVAAGSSRVVLLTTRVAPHGGANTVHLSAARAGVHGLVSAFAEELDEYAVRMHALAPGPVFAPDRRPPGMPPGVSAGSREEVARAVLELISAEEGDPVSTVYQATRRGGDTYHGGAADPEQAPEPTGGLR